MHFSTYVGSEIWFIWIFMLKEHTWQQRDITSKCFFSELPLIWCVRQALTEFFVNLSKKSGINECLWKLKANVGRLLILTLGVLCIELKEFGSSIGDRELIISTYHMSQKLRGASRLLFGNGCLTGWKCSSTFFLSSWCKLIFFSNWCIVYYQMHLYCVFLAQKVKWKKSISIAY